MISQEIHTELRRLIEVDGNSERNTAKILKISRSTVKSNLKKERPKYQRIAPYKKPVSDQYIAIIEGIIKSDANVPRKQKHTAAKIYEKLVNEYNYTGSDRLVRLLVQKIKKKPSPKFIPLEYDPGCDAQVDFSEVLVKIQNVETKIHLFSMVLSYSGVSFVKAYLRENTEAFVDGHIEAFKYFQGVPQRISYDNLSIAVTKVLKGKDRLLTEVMKNLSSHYLFKTNFCQPAKGNEKGIVEKNFQPIKRNWFTGIPEFESINKIQEYLLKKCESDKQRTKGNQKISIGEAYEIENSKLATLPAKPYDGCTVKFAKVDNYSTISYKNNHYSVPVDTVDKKVTLKIYYDKIIITDGIKIIAEHERSYGTKKYVLNHQHYYKELLKKPGCIPNAKPLRQASLPISFWQIYNELTKVYPNNQVGKFFVNLLMAYDKNPVLKEIIKQALNKRLFNIPILLEEIKKTNISENACNISYLNNFSSLNKPITTNDYAQLSAIR